MSGFKNKDMDNRRRQLLLGGLAFGATGLLQACGGGSADSGDDVTAVAQPTASTSGETTLLAESAVGGVTTPAPIPSHVVNLANYGGVPGAAPATIISAFNQAFNQLKGLGGGTLTVGAGVYNFGTLSGGTAVTVSDLQNVLISAYGAQLTMAINTTDSTARGTVTPQFLQFNNPNNITVAGLAFKGIGTNIGMRNGPLCLFINSTRACSRFKTVDCAADNVIRFLGAQQPHGINTYTFEGIDVHATVRNAYYGVSPQFNGNNSKVNLTVHNVRRAFIGYGIRNWDVTVNGSADGVALGSNAFIELAADDRGYVDTVKVNLVVTGNLRNYRGLVTFYHQSSSTVSKSIRNVKANVTLNNVTGAATTVFLFPYEVPNSGVFASTTINTWEQIQLNANVIGSYNGTMIQNPSVSSRTTNSIYVANNLVAYQKANALPVYFKVFTSRRNRNVAPDKRIRN
jgi:hypothetical protein